MVGFGRCWKTRFLGDKKCQIVWGTIFKGVRIDDGEKLSSSGLQIFLRSTPKFWFIVLPHASV